MRKRRERKKIKHRIRKKRIFIPTTRVMDTIVNTPLHPETGLPMHHKREVICREKVRAGFHIHWRVLLYDDKDRLYLREVINNG